jgi:hypothetical protein
MYEARPHLIIACRRDVAIKIAPTRDPTAILVQPRAALILIHVNSRPIAAVNAVARYPHGLKPAV